MEKRKREWSLLEKVMMVFFVIGITHGACVGCLNTEPEPMEIEFRQRFEGVDITLGNDGQVSGTFDGAFYIHAEDGEFTGFIVTMSDGFYFHGIDLGDNARANVHGTIERIEGYCFEAVLETQLPIEAIVIGCQGEPEIDLLVWSGDEEECSVLYAVDRIDPYFGGEEE